MNPDLDFDPSQYTRLPPYLDNATTVALGRQLVAAASGIVAPAVKKSTAVVSRATQKLADGMAELVGLDAPLSEVRETRGRLKVEGERRSVLGDFGRWIAGVGLRESGF